VDLEDESPEVSHQLGGKLSLLESAGDKVIAEAGQSQPIEIILFHEEIKKLRGNDGQGRYGDIDGGTK
jgi:hypothetical protein